MDVKEIKQSISMFELLSKYDIEIKNNMCRCPFHADKSPSMKVFKDGCHCFTCNKSWDIFSFTQEIEHCDFKTAYLSLGGHYERRSGDGEILRKARLERLKKQREQEARDQRERFREFIRSISLSKVLLEQQPLSEEWTDGFNHMEMVDRIIRGESEITQYVFKRCIMLRQKYLDVS